MPIDEPSTRHTTARFLKPRGESSPVFALVASADVALLERAIARSGLSLRDFARRELVRDERTLRAYRRGAPMPDVVREKVAQLARRRRSVKV